MRITLATLEAYYNMPLTTAAKQLKVSNTMLKKLCRKYGIQRWPHRQIRSIDKEVAKHQEARARATSMAEVTASEARIALLEKKRVIVTKTASCGLNASLRSAIFMARPGEIDAEQLFSSGKFCANCMFTLLFYLVLLSAVSCVHFFDSMHRDCCILRVITAATCVLLILLSVIHCLQVQ
jgi:RWP-RK domain